MTKRPELEFVGNPDTTLDDFPIQVLAEGIELLDAYVDHGQEKIEGVVRWFELDLEHQGVFRDSEGSTITPTHGLFQLLETEGINQATWRFRLDEGSSHIWGLVTKNASKQKFRLTRITDQVDAPSFTQFEPATEDEAYVLGDQIGLDLVALDIESLITGQQLYDDDTHFTVLLKAISQGELTIPGIAENGHLLPAVYAHLMSIIAKNTDIE